VDVHDVAYGYEYDLELVFAGTTTPSWLTRQAEILLEQSTPGEPWLAFGGRREPVQGRRRIDRDLLDRLLGQRQPMLCWADVPRGAQYVKVHLNVFDQGDFWPATDPIRIGVDERIHQGIERVAGSDIRQRRSESGHLRGLHEEFLLPPRPGETVVRSIASGSVDRGMSLLGRSHVLDVEEREDGTLFAIRLTRRRPTTPHGPLTLLSAPLEMVNSTAAARLDEDVLAQLRSMCERSTSYLDLWRRYNELDRELVLSRTRDLGWEWYTAREILADGTWRFQLKVSKDSREFLRRARLQRDGDGLDLVASGEPPTFDDEDSGDSRDHRGESARGPAGRGARLIGQPIRINVNAATVVIKPTVQHDEERPPPLSGYLYRAYRGDEAQLDRRERARDRISSGAADMPGLAALLEGFVPPEPRAARRYKPLSPAAKAQFARDPVTQQRIALDVALNTPDIALIQGPPGTGKTQLIAALQQRLLEIGESVEVHGSSLVTSFQHTAVDNAARRIRARGLPPSRIDSRTRRGAAEIAEEWRKETITRVQRSLPPESERWRRVRTLEDLVIGYITRPPTVTATIPLLAQVAELAEDLVPFALREQVIQTRAELDRREAARTATRPRMVEPLRRLVRGLRCSTAAYADDGAARAAALLRALPGEITLTPDAHIALTSAATGDSLDEDALVALRHARDDLLDQLMDSSGPPAAPAADPRLRELLEEVVSEAMGNVRESADGVHIALADYLDELRNDPELVQRTLTAYSPVRAATCQQVDSQLMRLAMPDGLVFDTVIVDETARVNPLDLMIPLSLARRRIVLVGDHAQLPHILERKLEEKIKELEGQTARHTQGSNDDWLALLRESLFQRLYSRLAAVSNPQRTVRLDTQFRMHPVLGAFVSRNFYEIDGPPIKPGVPEDERRHGLPAYGDHVTVWLDVDESRGPARRVRTSYIREAEADRIAAELVDLADQAPHLTFGVITFYSAQVEQLWLALANRDLAVEDDGEFHPVPKLRHTPDGRERLRVGTVDAFQGSEFDVVLLSTVRSSPLPRPDRFGAQQHYGHLTSPNRLCVAMSRAMRLLIGVGDASMFRRDVAPPAVSPITQLLEMSDAAQQVRT
jgi:hypothetical protein